MEHHRSFNVYSKHTWSERIVDTLFFKHEYLTSPIVAPEDTVVKTDQRLIEAVTAKYKGAKSEKNVSLKQLIKLFKTIAEKNSQEVVDKQLKKNGIKMYNE